MSLSPVTAQSEIERRYGPDAAYEWNLLLTHFKFADNFVLLILTVPDQDGADLCAQAIEEYLAPSGKHLDRIEPATPEELRRVALPLLRTERDASVGAVWVGAVVPQSAPDLEQWERAWHYALGTLNQQRNPIRRDIQCPLLMVGAPWLVQLFRRTAPDLWSVRSQIVRITPSQESRNEVPRVENEPQQRKGPSPFDTNPDLDLALQEIAALRDRPELAPQHAEMLARAAIAYFNSGDYKSAEDTFRAQIEVLESVGDSVSISSAMNNFAVAILHQGRFAEAETLLRQALTLKEQGGDTATARGITLDGLARTIHDQGRFAEAETLFRQALALAEEGGDTATARGIVLDGLARTIRDQGRFAEAETLFRQALALAEEGGGTATSRGIVLDGLARTIHDQGRFAEAETLFRQALKLAEEGGDTPSSRAVTLRALADTIRAQGRTSEADALLAQAAALTPDTPTP